jgi:hypothetical protein
LRVLWRIVGPKREEVMGGCRRLNNEEFHNTHISPNIIRVGQVACMGKVVPVLFLTEHNALKAYWGVEV